ncbi:MAG: hypothetical protein AAF682_10235 [Planctomycetota bacterium]
MNAVVLFLAGGTAFGQTQFHFSEQSWLDSLEDGCVVTFDFSAANVSLASEVTSGPTCPGPTQQYGQFLTFDGASTGLSTSFQFEADPVGNNACFQCPPLAAVAACGDAEHDWWIRFTGGAPTFAAALDLGGSALSQYTVVVEDAGGTVLGTQPLLDGQNFVGIIAGQPIGTVFLDDNAVSGGSGINTLRWLTTPDPLLATETTRAGSPPNPIAFLPGQTTRPILGGVWDPVIDHTSFVPSATTDLMGITANPLNLAIPPFGTLLCDPSLVVAIEVVPAGQPFAIPVPSECSFIGASVCTQGASVDPLSSILFTNALDITIGTF